MDCKKIDEILNELENNNIELYNHNERVAKICYATCRLLNLSFKEREISYFSGLLHNIGKFYLSIVDDDNTNYDVRINGSIIYFDKSFRNVMYVVNTYKLNKQYDIDKYNFNINLLNTILNIANEYDTYRYYKHLKHEETCKILREKEKLNNKLLTSIFIAIIKEKLNNDY